MEQQSVAMFLFVGVFFFFYIIGCAQSPWEYLSLIQYENKIYPLN